MSDNVSVEARAGAGRHICVFQQGFRTYCCDISVLQQGFHTYHHGISVLWQGFRTYGRGISVLRCHRDGNPSRVPRSAGAVRRPAGGRRSAGENPTWSGITVSRLRPFNVAKRPGMGSNDINQDTFVISGDLTHSHCNRQDGDGEQLPV